MPQALVYARVSTDEQAEKGRSIDDQIAVCSREAEAHGFTLSGVYADPGKSGSLPWDRRPGLKELVTHCQQPLVEAVYVLDTDRIARDAHQHLTIKTIFKKFGVKMVSVNQPSLSDNTPESSLIDTIIAAVNGYLPKVTGRKSALAMEEKVKEGWWPGWAPLGYRNVNIGTKDRPKNIIRVDPVTAALIVEMFELYATGVYSLRRLAKEMERRGLLGRTGKVLTVGRIHYRLQDPFYIGLIRFRGKQHPGKHESLISRELFEKVQSVLNRRDRYADTTRKHTFLLRGYVHCHQCGGRLTAESHPAKGKSYYRCGLTIAQHSNRGQNVEVTDLERQVEVLFQKIQLPRAFVEKVMARAQSVLKETHEGLDEERRLLQIRQSRLEEQRDRVEQKLFDGIINDEAYSRNHSKLEASVADVKEKIRELEEDRSENIVVFEQLLNLARGIHKAYVNAPLSLKQRYLEIFWERIEVGDRMILKAVPTQAMRTLFKSDLAEDTVRYVEEWGPSDQRFRTLLQNLPYWERIAKQISALGKPESERLLSA